MTDDPHRFDGRTALVTGAARGIGARVAGLLADCGCAVACADAADPAGWDLPTGPGHTAHRADVTRTADCERLIDEVRAAHGRLDHLVHCAAIVRRGPAATTEDADFTEVLDVNLTGTFRVTRAAYPALVAAPDASVVTLGSTNGSVAVADSVGYCVSKAGVMHLSRVLALEWASAGIRVNSVAPTIVPTSMTSDVRADPAYMAAKLASIPLGRPVSETEVAQAVTFLLSPASAMTTGQVLFVDGGATIH
ncbi:SDR family NAD(P)-dependent oxidoreductase [Streptomyces oceani]|uniref:Short-chain dehydrogenase n=1 Tax=Streptomyces oceani TaxID=1075402 RepID=A0A1E7JY03_9ACTN|nr:SDR family NAD(P)-dependent oxidoreductase [Streptomyces oceani]OEU96541.1 short-chain dehydrogenase [Streptomyces oceani]